MSLRIDPRVPHVWRTPNELQFGVDRPLVLLHTVSNAQERMIAALVAGVPRQGLEVIAARAGAEPAQVDRLLRKLAPVLLTPTPTPSSGEQAIPSSAGASAGATAGASAGATAGLPAEPRRTVLVQGDGRAAQIVATLLSLAGTAVSVRPLDVAPAARGRRPSAVVLLADFVLPPAVGAHWLRRDVPHLPVIFGDTGAVIGPFVRPGEGPCLHCVERAKADADPAWTAMATQLLGADSPVHSAGFDLDVALRAVAALRRRPVQGAAAGDAHGPTGTTSIRVLPDGDVSVLEHLPHARCGCRALPENATAPAAPSAAATCGTSSATASAAPS